MVAVVARAVLFLAASRQQCGYRAAASLLRRGPASSLLLPQCRERPGMVRQLREHDLRQRRSVHGRKQPRARSHDARFSMWRAEGPDAAAGARRDSRRG